MSKLGPLYFREVGRSSPRSSLALHPAIWLTIVWTAILAIWAVVPDETFLRVTGTSRYSSANSFTFMILMLLAFVAGTLMGPSLLRLRTPARRTAAVEPERTTRVLGTSALVTFAVGLLTIGFILVQGFAKAGGPSAIFSDLLSGVSSQELANTYFISSRVQGLTVWAQLNAATAALGTLALLMDGKRSNWSRVLPPILAVGLALAVVQAFVLNDRLAVYEYLVVVATTWIGYRIYEGKPLLTASIATRAALVVLISAGVWFGAEFGRTYLARYGPNADETNTADALSPSQVASDSLLAYLLSGPNNGLYAVDHTENHSYVYRTFKGVFTTLTLDSRDTPIIGDGIGESSRLLGEIYHGPLAFTVYSFVGNAYFDLGWAGLLVGFWFGFVVGGVHYKFSAGELWASLVYPFLFVGVLDSWRVTYWAESRMLVPVFALLVVSFILYKRAEKAAPATDISPPRVHAGVVHG